MIMLWTGRTGGRPPPQFEAAFSKQESVMSSFIPSPFLRQVLIADAVTSAASGVMMFAGSGFLAGLLGLPAPLLSYAGLSLLPFAALVGLAASRPSLPRLAVWAIIACNAVWALDSVAILFSGW